MERSKLLSIARAIQAFTEHKKYNLIDSVFPLEGPFSRFKYKKHWEFFCAGKNHRFRVLGGGNGSGKSFTGAVELTYHMTGEYPNGWEGYRFNKAIKVWVICESGSLWRDSMQQALLGSVGEEVGTGLIRKSLIHDTKSMPGVPGAVGQIQTKHKLGGVSSVTVKTFEMGRNQFQAATLDLLIFDEEPPEEIYAECIMRTRGVKGIKEPGRVMMLFTPLKGLSEVVLRYLPNGRFPLNGEHPEHPDRYAIAVSWDDAPHLSEEDKKTMMAEMPPNERDARTKGIPALGAGRVYPIAEDDITVKPFKIPEYFPRAYGLDFGWNNCLAADSMVLMPDGSQKAIQDIQIGEQVLAFDFRTENLVPTNVVSTFKGFAYNMVTVAVTPEQQITCTDDHPFAHRAQPNDTIKFKKIREINQRIREFQSVVLPKKWELDNENNICSPEMARIIGYLLGDGCLTYTNRQLEFAQVRQEYIDDMRRCLEVEDCQLKSYENQHRISGKKAGKNKVLDFIKELGLLGTNSKTKFIPTSFMTASKEIINNLLVGLVHTDGSIDGDHVRYYTVSKEMAEGVKTLCLRLGIYSSISCDYRKRKETHNICYKVTLRRPTQLELMAPKRLKNKNPERKKRADRLLTKYESAPPQDIYCITVDHPDHAFICNGFVVSNTAALWMAQDPVTQVKYLYAEYKKGKVQDSEHVFAIKQRGDWMSGAADPSGGGRRDDGRMRIDYYRSLGLDLYPGHNGIIAGISQVYNDLTSGMLKIFSNLHMFLDEFRIYRYDSKDPNKVARNQDDHLLDTLRYLISIFEMISKSEYDLEESDRIEIDDRNYDPLTGY